MATYDPISSGLLADMQAAREMHAEAQTITATVAAAISALARAYPGRWPSYKTEGGHTHHADCNAPGEDLTRYGRPGMCIREMRLNHVGGQNSGAYGIQDGGLYLEPDGDLVTAAEVDGSWSEWQGSTIHWEITRWAAVTPDEDTLAHIIVALRKRTETFRDRCRARRARGAETASRVLEIMGQVS